MTQLHINPWCTLSSPFSPIGLAGSWKENCGAQLISKYSKVTMSERHIRPENNNNSITPPTQAHPRTCRQWQATRSQLIQHPPDKGLDHGGVMTDNHRSREDRCWTPWKCPSRETSEGTPRPIPNDTTLWSIAYSGIASLVSGICTAPLQHIEVKSSSALTCWMLGKTTAFGKLFKDNISSRPPLITCLPLYFH